MFNIKDLFANRIGGKKSIENINVSIFNKMQKAKKETINKGNEVLDFSTEELYGKIDDTIVDCLAENIKKKDKEINCLEFNKACLGYLRVEHGVDLDYKSEIIDCIDIKEALNILSLGFVNKEDYVITTIPGNSIMADIGKILECNVYEYKLNKFNNYLIDFEDIDENILKKCKLLYLNYPNNPTGAIATKEFFKEAIKYAKKYNFIIINDASYIDFCFDELDKISFLSIEGAKDVGIELHTLSKSFNMLGWKNGFMVGNKDVIKVFEILKGKIDSGQIEEIKTASVIALNNYERINKELKTMYKRRHELIKEVLNKNGFKADIPKAGFFQYVDIPKSCNGVGFETAEEFALWFIENVNVLVIPYDIEGKKIRFSMTFYANQEDEERKIAEKLNEKLSKFKFDF